ncbi:hypothetical protein [Psychroserpens jangbogonensis]|uniref:hypothetical protein n=1 Tax=Psychroserpens jangbogonensis TaxID=1484460 RepID=UPI00053F1E1D|nr:hypothetical protein [Psychroserpens jangbogonensis]
MNYVNQTNSALLSLLKFKIRFSEINNAYLLNDKWVNEIDGNYFMNQVENVKQLLIKLLRNGIHHEEYLQKLIDRIWNRIQGLDGYKIHSPDIIKVYSEIKAPIIRHKETPYAKKDLYNEFRQGQSLETNVERDQFTYLNFITKNLNNYETRMDFEYGLLSYAIYKYHEAVSDLHNYVFSLHSNARYIDFKNLEVEGGEEIKQKIKKDIICNFNLNKKSIAHLQRIMIEERIVVFDETSNSNNRLHMKKFLEDNYTYQNSSKDRVQIKSFNREYAEAVHTSHANIEEHKIFIDKAIEILQNRKNRLGTIEYLKNPHND